MEILSKFSTIGCALTVAAAPASAAKKNKTDDKTSARLKKINRDSVILLTELIKVVLLNQSAVQRIAGEKFHSRLINFRGICQFTEHYAAAGWCEQFTFFIFESQEVLSRKRRKRARRESRPAKTAMAAALEIKKAE
ncbi:MAG: hypothetical protein M3384_03375 [Acidobacteriota bacterium]|nr:hypothetical protein [Acidobacteriota bacterium]